MKSNAAEINDIYVWKGQVYLAHKSSGFTEEDG